MCRHGSEPAVSLTYSDKSSTSATISLGVGDEMTRDSYHAGEAFFPLTDIVIVFLTHTDSMPSVCQGHLEVTAPELSMQVRVIIIEITAIAMSEKVSDSIIFHSSIALSLYRF